MSHKEKSIVENIVEPLKFFALPHLDSPREEVRPIENEVALENENENEEIEEILSNVGDQNMEETPLRRSVRTRQPSTRLRDFITYKVQYPIQNFIAYGNISSKHKTFLTSIAKEQEPNNYEEAIKNST